MLKKNPHSLPTAHYEGGRKRFFIALAIITSIILCALLFLGWVIPYVGFANLHPIIPTLSLIILVVLIALIIWATFVLVLHIYTGQPRFGSQYIRDLSIRFHLPLMELVARLIGISPGKLRNSFIKVNNELLLTNLPVLAPKDILLLLPHCLQNSLCKNRLTHSMDTCTRCGKCCIADILNVRDAYGIHLAIATGGTIARRIVTTTRPKFIIAVACERDLTSGIQDAYPIPVYGILNERPNGPCLDTTVPILHITDMLDRLIHPKKDS